ncbi:hypothetical protein CEXT_187861 [Caerostris extrusa]|uniref:Uncharacterized protein n=1 Tax=Caerostris extrusa TaxID=172846 RepID=A0AAV4MPE8_CAEEX|nr:hypothetical protein CEXT_187861 [Caerostris extrusa]
MRLPVLNRILAAVKMFPGSSDSLYNALLNVINLNSIDSSAYHKILNLAMTNMQHQLEGPVEYLKFILLCRKVNCSLENPIQTRAVIDIARNKIPDCLKFWMLEHQFEAFEKDSNKKIAKKLLNKSLKKNVVKKLEKIILPKSLLRKIATK